MVVARYTDLEVLFKQRPKIPLAIVDSSAPIFDLSWKTGLPKFFYHDLKTGRRIVERTWQLQILMFGMLLIQLFAGFFKHLSFSQILPSLVITLPLFAFAMRILWTKRMRFYKDGLIVTSRFPLMPERFTYDQVVRRWSDLDSIRFQKAGGMSELAILSSGRGDSLIFDWNAAKNTTAQILKSTNYINLDKITKSDREGLFLALSKLVPQEVLSPEVLYLQVQSLSGSPAIDLQDYTKVWLEEYTRRFELANYINLSPGTVCGGGRFTITMTIAARVSSSTYLAQSNDKSHNKYVIKELVAPLDSDDAMQSKLLEQFNREAATLAKLQHPSIVSVVDHFIENGRSYIVMEQASGKNMREHLRLNGKLSQMQVVSIAAQLIDVLKYLHHHSPAILHRDFTPDNMIYGEDGKVTVIDFGAANVYNTGKTATLIGKQSYMPPEQLRGKPCPASDIYAFGATLSYLLSGKNLVSMGELPSFADADSSPAMLQLLNECVAFDWQERPDCDDIAGRINQLKNANSQTAAAVQ